MLDYLTGTPVPMEVDFQPSPSGGGMYFWQEEEVHNCYLIMLGYTPDMTSPGSVETRALLTAVGFVQSVFGYPNEDAYYSDPRGDIRHGCYEIKGSRWKENIDDANRRSFGSPYFDRPFGDLPEVRHYFIGSKDASCQILARELRVEPLPGMTFSEILAESHRRVAQDRAAVMKEIQKMIDRNSGHD